jgi:hypothetical protein
MPAYAEKNSYVLPVQKDPNWDYGREWFAVNWGPMLAGDCQQNSAYVTMSPPDSDGNVTIGWGSGILFTRHTNHADVWHQSFQFKTLHNTTVLAIGGFDGPQMTKINTNYSNYVFKYAKVDPELWPLIDHVIWTGDC